MSLFHLSLIPLTLSTEGQTGEGKRNKLDQTSILRKKEGPKGNEKREGLGRGEERPSNLLSEPR